MALIDERHCLAVKNGYEGTEFISTNIVSAFIKQWPIWLGIGIVLIVVSTIIFALYKTKSFGKFRFFKGKIEDVKKENNEIRRRSQMHISNKTSVMLTNLD